MVARRAAADTVCVDYAPSAADLLKQGIDHHGATRYHAAARCYSQAVDLQDDCAPAWRLLGVIAIQSGNTVAARRFIERALGADAGDAAAYAALGQVNESERRPAEAYAAYAAAWGIDATQEAASLGLARTALALGRAGEAAVVAEAAVARGSANAALLRTLGAARLKLRRYAGARDALVAALEAAPHADAFANLGAAHLHLHDLDAALRACGRALALDPEHAAAHNNLGVAHKAHGDPAAATAAFDRAVALGSEEARVNRGLTRLLTGDYRRGWPDYGSDNAERRANRAVAELPMWDGRPAPGRRLLIWPEQGVGDSIQMVRFVARARALVGSVTLAGQAGTLDLMRGVAGVDAVVDVRAPLAADAFDLWLPTIRLPVVFDVDAGSLESEPYLRADPRVAERLRPLLAAPPGVLRVGLNWAGSPEHEWDAIRSCRLEELAALGDVPGVAWFALQHGAAAAQETRALTLVPINAHAGDFGATAAIVAQLDLVITVDTSVAHLAGALGRPAWVLLSHRPDWRWGTDGERSAWYPTLRLFRKREHQTWPQLAAHVARALSAWSAGGPALS